jgi:hypothetical protein
MRNGLAAIAAGPSDRRRVTARAAVVKNRHDHAGVSGTAEESERTHHQEKTYKTHDSPTGM